MNQMETMEYEKLLRIKAELEAHLEEIKKKLIELRSK
jgi:ribosomal protein L29